MTTRSTSADDQLGGRGEDVRVQSIEHVWLADTVLPDSHMHVAVRPPISDAEAACDPFGTRAVVDMPRPDDYGLRWLRSARSSDGKSERSRF